MRAFRLAGSLLLISLSLTACTSQPSPSASTRPDTSALTKEILTHCTDLAAPELGAGTLCIDNGFRLTTDDFSFANWGLSPAADNNVTAQTLVDLFGHDAVCTNSNENTCILRPTAIQKLEELNTALSGGRCEGLATLSTRFNLGMESPSAFQDGATSTAELQRSNPQLNSAIVYWWATQFLSEVQQRAAASRSTSPLHIVNDLIQGLAHSVGYTVGLYDGASGHSVTPFAVTHRGKHFVIHVYDNNFPGKRREIFINSTTNQWRYPNAFTNADGTYSQWSGGAGSLELTAMSSRKGPFQCSFCNTSLTDTPHVITVASRDVAAAGYVHVTTDKGDFRVTPTRVSNEIPGATYSVGKGNAGGLVTISLPQDITSFDVHVSRASQDVPASDVTVGLRRSDGATLQVSGDLAHDVVNQKNESAALLAGHRDSTIVQAPTQNTARVSLSAGSQLSRRTLPAGESMTVRLIADNSIEIALKGASGGRTPFVKIPLIPQSDTTELTIAIGENGAVTMLPTRINPVRVASALSPNFTPGKARQTTTTTVPSIEISEPD
jgi:hypothetical protein